MSNDSRDINSFGQKRKKTIFLIKSIFFLRDSWHTCYLKDLMLLKHVIKLTEKNNRDFFSHESFTFSSLLGWTRIPCQKLCVFLGRKYVNIQSILVFILIILIKRIKMRKQIIRYFNVIQAENLNQMPLHLR